MPTNFPGPYEIRLYYTISGLQHIARYNCDLVAPPTPGTPFSDHDVVLASTASEDLQVAVDAWVALFRPCFAAATGTVDFAELWQYTSGTFDASFVSVYNIGLAMTGAGAASLAAESIMTLRTLEGGIMKLYFEETNVAVAIRDSPPFAPAAFEAIRTHVTGGNNFFLGRDTSYPFAAIALFHGQNERIFKLRYRF